MTNINKVSQAINAQTPEFIRSDYKLFNKFVEYYYRSQEKTGLGQNLLNNFLQYLDIDKLDISILDGATKVVEDVKATDETIVVETIDAFLEKNGSVMIGDEVIYYEKTTSAPNIALSPGISYDQVKLKWTGLANPLKSFDGTTTSFPLTSQNNPVAPPSAQHLIVSVYGETLIPNIDYTVSGTNIVFTTAPRLKLASDGESFTYITYLSGFVENTIVGTDNISNTFGDSKKQFTLTRNGVRYAPEITEYVIAVYDNKLLIPKVDFFLDDDQFIFKTAPLNGRALSVYAIEAPIPSFGSNAVGYSRVDDTGNITSIAINANGTGYRYEYPPKVSINSDTGSGASATALVNGIKSVALLDGGKGYSDTNPPTVVIQTPTKTGSSVASVKATVTNGEVSGLEVTNSGSGYTFTPRLTFLQPGGAILGAPTISSGQITGTVPITTAGQGYTTVPTIYVDEPTGSNPIRANLRAVLTDGKVTSVTILNAGQGYETVPRIAIIDPVGAQILQTSVDGDGRVINIEILSGGGGYEDTPSVYIVDDRVNDLGVYIGGTGATATASIFNGQIIDINITNFGTGYSAVTPPQIIIQSPPSAEASATIGLNEVTGFTVNQAGSGYTKAQFEGCARAASAIKEYTEDGNAVFSNNTVASAATKETTVKCLDAVFVKRLLDKYTEQFLPDVPSLDYTKIDVRNSIKTIKDFYSSKGTSYSIAYLFKLLYGETVSISYPKDQIIKPSDATWSIDTILRATLVSGNPDNIRDGLLTQDADIADTNVLAASALIENFISIKTSETEIFELVLSEETIVGKFTVPYKTRLAEPLTATAGIITVDSTIGWPERNGEFVIGTGATAEVVQYKEKSLNQFIECTRSVNGVVEDWDSATGIASNFTVYVNKGTSQEVVMNIVGIVDAEQTTLTDTGSYYLPGDKLTVSKLGGTGEGADLKTWLYNVKKLVTVTSITYGGVNNQSATVTCANAHGLLVGDQVTVYGANPIIYNGSFFVTSRDTANVFQYQLPQPATVVPQGNILVSVDLNKGKSDNTAILNVIGPYTTNVQNTFFNDTHVYVASTGIPNYEIGPFPGSALLPGNQRKLNRFPKTSQTISTKNLISSNVPVGTWVNGVSIWSYKSKLTKTFGALTAISITTAGKEYDAASPPAMTIDGGGGSGATASVTVDGSISEITVTAGGSGYTSSPLVSIVGGNGAGAAATAIITKGVVSRILINDGGSGYTSQPQITIVGGGGSGATATASVRGPIKTVAITSGGASYTSVPTVSLSSGSGAVAQAIVNDGRIISIAIISAGSGYTTAPEVTIQGVGFGAIARATIDTDGENAGRVTNIEIINKGINYVQGTTLINLTSIGSEATFTPSVFQWTYNLQATSTFDAAKGAVFEGYNNEYGGEYAHLSNPQKLRYILGDNLFQNTDGAIKEQETQLAHSPIIGWAFDGNPIYGPYGYTDPTDQTSTITKLNTSYRLKTNLVFDATNNPFPSRTAGPLITDEASGNFVEDYEYVFGLGALDQYNGRFCKTPDFPDGRYVYFVTIDATEDGNPLFPYVIGPSYNSVVDTWNLTPNAIQQNIPTGVVRYRDPYENVDIDVERTPNAASNALTMENGDILLFDAEDDNRDGVIESDEVPRQMFEESPLQLFDYFPKVKFDSKVDIEVETTTKFEDASVTGFTVENPGKNYQVDDRLVFDNTDTDGSGVSARVSRIKGETVSAYTFENISGFNFGVLQTSIPHNIVAGDQVFVDYTPIMANTNKTFIVRQFKGIEQIVIDQTGSGYNTDIPPSVIIDGDGSSGELEATVSSVGSIDTINIINSGSGYTKNPRVILTHPQIFKKADYYISKISNNSYVKINDVHVADNKESYLCGMTKDASGNQVAFIAKVSATGVKQWERTLESNTGQNYTEFQKIFVDGNSIWVVGGNKPNGNMLSAYNPDIILAKYTQAENGLSAALTFQKGYAGISGSTRADYVTSLKKYSDTRFIIAGYTNTNSGAPFDAWIASIDTTGNFAIKRKLATTNASEKITDLIVNGTDIYLCMEVATTSTEGDVNPAIAKITLGVNAFTVDWIKQYTNVLYSSLDTSICIDEFNEIYLTSTLRLKSDDTTRDSFWVGKVDSTGDLLWNYRYVTPGRDISLAKKSVIDIFGDLNIAFTRTNNTNTFKTVDSVKIGYDGKLKNHSTNSFTNDNVEGLTVHSLDVDNSGDIHLYGQTNYNRNEFIFDFASNATTDVTGHYTLNTTSATNSITVAGNLAKIYGYNPAGLNSSWVNSYFDISSSALGTKLANDWTLEFFIHRVSSESQTLSQTNQTLFGIGGAQDATGGLWLGYDMSSGKLQFAATNNSTALSGATPVESTQTNMFANNSWQVIGVKKEGNDFKVYVNGIQVITGIISNTALGAKTLYFGNQVGWGTGAGDFKKERQGQFYIDNIRLRNGAVVPTVPNDIQNLPPTDTFALSYSWNDTSWFTTNLNRYDYIDYVGWGLKVDKDADAARIGTQSTQTNTQIGFTRTAVSPVTGSVLTVTTTGISLASAGLQSLDYDDATITLLQDTETLTYTQDTWSSRTATVPSPGSQKLKVSAVVKDRYFFKVTNTIKIDNIQELTVNQAFNFTVGAKLRLNNDSGTFVNSGYIIKTDTVNNKVYLAVNNNAWTDDLNTGKLVTEQFNEQSSYGIVGPIPNDTNIIQNYVFSMVNNTTPGTFDIDLDDYNLDGTGYNAGGGQNLDGFAKFKPFLVADYSVKIEEVAGGSPFIVGSVVNIAASNISFNATYTTAQVTGLTAVTKITLTANLNKTLQVTAVANTNEVYVITATSHYLNKGEILYVDGNPSQTVGGTVYDEYDGAFAVDTIVSPLEFTYKLPTIAITDPATSAGTVSIFVKSPTLKMYYGHQYLFDLSHSSLVGGNLSFSKDNLYKLEYSFNSIERIGIPGVTGGGQPSPSVKLKIDDTIVTNISYYFDPSRTGDTSPVVAGSYLDVVESPYKGTFDITSTSGQTITSGPDTFKFLLANEPEGNASISQTSYSTSSVKAVGSINAIRIVNPGGFYTKLPVVTGISSTRKIERATIEEPGTEYAVGTYNGVPITGDGEGGLVQITVADGLDDDGITIPGQINAVVITSAGKGYTTASIDIDSVAGILGSGLTGSGAKVNVIIPPFGTEASIFTKGDKVGKIKKLKNNNFGYDYPHDYTLRPEITFPLNAQLTSTSILSSITVTNPGSGYSLAPAVIITGGGGSGATAESSIKNGRLDNIVVKDPGAGYSSTPTISLRSSFNYVVNLDLGLLQFAYPHGIVNGAAVSVAVTDTGDGADFPLAAGAIGRLNATTTYYAIAGATNSLEGDQLKLAITASNAALGDAISFVNAGEGRQSVLTESFGGAAEANVITSTFLEGELVYQGDTLDVATATGYVSTNSGWQIGPRILKIVDYTGTFANGQKITGVISKSSGTISDLKVARGVLEIGSITKTTGQFIDDVGKPSEIIQKIQDSYYYQDFSYAVKSAVSISDWKEILIRNVHPASFKVFGELNLNEYGQIPNKDTFFQLTKSVELAQEAIVPNIQNFALVEPIYTEFNNTEVLFRQKRLTSSENILTSVVQRIDDISNLFDGQKIAFPLTVNGNNVVANANQLMIVLNGVVQNPETSFNIQSDSIVFSEPPSPPASVKYANITVSQIQTVAFTFTNISGIFPNIGNPLVGSSTNARLIVTNVTGNTVSGYITEGTFVIGELVSVGATGFSALLASNTAVSNIGLFTFGENVTNLTGDIAKVEQINLATGQETPAAQLRYAVGPSTTSIEVIPYGGASLSPVTAGTFVATQNYQFGSEIFLVNSITDNADSTTLGVSRGQVGTQAVAQQENTPVYSTVIAVTNALTLSKTAGTYKSTPGLFDIQLNDIIIGSNSGVVASVASTSAYQDPTTNEFIGQVNISPGSSFFGLLFNRITSSSYPNVVLDNISQSQVNVVDFTDNLTAFDSKFPANELINNYVIPYDNAVGSIVQDEYVRNYRINYGNNVGDFTSSEDGRVRKLSFYDKQGTGFFNNGQIIRTRDTKAEVIGYSQARDIVYLGKIGRTQSNGEDYYKFTFSVDAKLDTTQKKFGLTSLELAAADYISTPSTTEIAFGSGVFTVDLWIRPATASLSGNVDIFDTRSSGATEVAGRLYLATGQPRWHVNGSDLVTTSTTLTADTWVHIAIVRVSTTTKIYINGTEAGTATDNSSYIAKPIRIGADYAGANGFTGHVDELRISNTSRYTTAFTAPNGIYQGDANTKLLLHFEGIDGGVHVEDWSGVESFTAGEYFNNDSIIDTVRKVAGKHTWAGGTANNAIRITGGVEKDVTDATYNPNTGDLVLTIGSHSYTTSNTITIKPNSLTFTCAKDNNATNHTYPRVTDPAYGATLAISAETATTITVNVGIANRGFVGNTQRYINAGDLITSNLDFIAKEVVYLINQKFPNFTVIGGNVNCEDDVRDVCKAIVFDIQNGSNSKIWDAASYYVNRADVNNVQLLNVEKEIIETVWAYGKLDEILDFIVTNSLWDVQGDHGLTQKTDTSITDSTTSSFTEITPTNVVYSAATGDLKITKSSHGFVGPSALTATGATYNPATGILEITSNSHGLLNGDKVQLEDDSLTFTCSMDENRSTHTYPRSSDHASQGWLSVQNKQTNTFQLDVGKTPNVGFQPSAATYDAESGLLTMDIGEHRLRAGTNVKLAKESLSFTCDMDDDFTTKKYPRTTDPVYNDSIPILYEGSRHTITFATYTPSSGKMVLTCGKQFSVTDAAYVPTTGVMTLTVPNHGLTVNDQIKIVNNSIVFTCAMDDHTTDHSYPRSTDPQSDKRLSLSNITTNTFDVNVGTTPAVNFTPGAGTTYNPATGDLVLAIGTHSLSVGDGIRIADNSLTFTCNYNGDGNSTQKTYPRSSGENGTAGGASNNTGTPDPAYQTSVYITGTTSTTITVNVGTSSDTSTHVFVTANSNAIVTGGDYAHIFQYAVPNGITYDNHRFENGDKVRLLDNSLTFTCQLDGNDTDHAYPRVGKDPYAGRQFKIANKTDKTFEINVGISPDKSTHTFKSAYPGGLIHVDNTVTLDVGKSPKLVHDISNAVYTPADGNMVLTLGTHDLVVGDNIKLLNEAVTFTCDQDSDVSEHAYPRTTIDTHQATTGTSYNPTTGIMSITTTSAHGMRNGDWVKFDDDSLTFNCNFDGYQTNKTYPRSTDPVSGKWIQVSNVASTTFDVQVLDVIPSTNLDPHIFVSGTATGIKQKRDKTFDTSVSITAVGTSNKTASGGAYNPETGVLTITSSSHGLTGASEHTVTNSTYTPSTGVLTLTIAGHGFTNGDRIRIKDDSITFTCSKDYDATIHTYPRSTDPVSNKFLHIVNVTTNTFDVNVGKSQDLSSHTFISATSNGIERAVASVKLDADSITFSCDMGGGAVNKTYPRTTDPIANQWVPITNSQTNSFDIFVGKTVFGNTAHSYQSATSNGIKVQDGTVTINVGISSNTTTHAFVEAKKGALIVGGVYTHTFVPQAAYSVTDASYNPTSGVMELTINGHGFENGDFIQIANESLTFSCGFNGASGTAAQKAYPRATDFSSGKWLEISNVATNTFDVQVLETAPSTNTDTHTFVSATSGGVVRSALKTGGAYTHTFKSAIANGIKKQGQAITIKPEGLTLKCNIDDNATKHIYPRKTDPAYNSALAITKYDTNTFTVNVGKSLANEENTPYTPTAATYDPSNGNMVLTLGKHTLTTSDSVLIEDESLKFSCTMDNNQSPKAYPRSLHDTRASGRPVAITAVGTTSHTITAADYNPVIGELLLTVANHGLSEGDMVKFDVNAIRFTCAKDSNATNHDYPRSTDPVADKWIEVRNVTTTQFRVNVGVSSDTSQHQFVSAVSGALKSQTGTVTVNVGSAGTNAQFTPSAATYDAETGNMTLTIGQHGMKKGSSVTIANAGLTFNCTMNGGSSNKQYPRSTDPYGNLKSIPVTHIGHTHHTITNATYSPGIGKLTITIPSHGFSNGDYVQIVDNSITFRCELDGNTTDHAYPRTGFDRASGGWFAVAGAATDTFDINVGVSSDTSTHVFKSATTKGLRKQSGVITVNVGASPIKGYDVSNAVFTPSTGVLVLTIGEHSLTSGTSLKIANNSLVFRCDADGQASDHSYPRANGQSGATADDPAYNDAVAIVSVTSNTVTLNVGTSSNTTTHAFQSTNNTYTASTAAYNPTTGVMTITSNGHGMINGEHIKIADNSLTFTCAQDSNATNHSYPRPTDPVSNRWLTISNVQTNTFDVQVLDQVPSTNLTAHTFVSATANGITRAVLSTGGAYTHTFVTAASNAVSYTPQSTHTFVSADPGSIKKISTTHTFVSSITNSIKLLNHNTADCTDVQTNIENLINILTDTLNAANLATPVDHLGAVTRSKPDYEFLGGKVGTYYEVPFPVSYHNSTDDQIYANQIDLDTQYRFRDAANLIRVNLGPIIDKASADMLSRYPDLALDMPRNANGTSTDGTLRCKTDLILIAEEIIKDIEDGGNLNSVNVAKQYLGTNDVLVHIRLQVFQSAYAHERLGFYMKQAIIGNLSGTNTDKIIVGDWDITQDPTTGTFTPTGATYDYTTGDLVLTIGSHTLAVGRMIQLAENGLTFSCNTGSGAVNKTYPRSIGANTATGADYAYNTNLAITSKTATTITVNVNGGQGPISNANTHTFVSATTNSVIVPGDCANVQDAIDTLVNTINDIIAPTEEAFGVAADRLYFNRDYIAEEITNRVTAEFTYTLNGINYSAFTYPGATGEATCRRDLKLIIVSMISDLQTGGNNSTVAAIEKYLTSTLSISYVEKELLPTLYAIEQLKELGDYAIRNRLFNVGHTTVGDQYAAQFTSQSAFQDSFNPPNILHVTTRFNELVDFALNILAPSRKTGRGAAKNILYNRNYYKQEITNLVNSQFGSGTWTYDTFLDEVVDDLVHDTIVTNTLDNQLGRSITIENVIGVFVKGETVRSNNNGTAIVLEFVADTNLLIVGTFTGSMWKGVDLIEGSVSGAVADISVGGVSDDYHYYNNPANVKTLATARLITSNISGQISGVNLFANPEAFTLDWSGNKMFITEDAITSPDATPTAEKIVSTSDNDLHSIIRNYTLSSSDTWDDGVIKFDDTNNKFDEGSLTNQSTQTYTWSVFIKAGELNRCRIQLDLDEGQSGVQRVFFDLNLTNGVIGSLFTPQGGVTGDAYGVVPYGDGWYRAYITATFSFGFSALQAEIIINDTNNAQIYAGNNSNGAYVWGAKLNKGALDPYTSVDGKVFFADAEFNIKNYALDRLEEYTLQALDDTLTSPGPSSTFLKFFSIPAAAEYDKRSVSGIVRSNLNLLREQLKQDTYYTGIAQVNGLSIPTLTYGTRSIPAGVGGGLQSADFLYGLTSDAYAELEDITMNEGRVVQAYQRFRIDGDITDGPFSMNEVVTKQGAPSITGVVYGFHQDENYKYLDVRVTAGPWAITDTLVGATNSTTAQISAIESRIQVIDLKGSFVNDIPFKGYTSGATATPTGFIKTDAAVLTNTGGTLTVDTETLNGTFETTCVVYPENSRQYIEVSKFAGLDIGIGSRIASTGYTRLQIAIVSGLNNFTVGNKIYKVNAGIQDTNTFGYITELDLDNNYIYVTEYAGSFALGDFIGDYGLESNPIGYATVSTRVVTPGAAAAQVQDIRVSGVNKRLYLSDIVGTFDLKDAIVGPESYESIILTKVDLKARVKRAFKGFDGTTTSFKLTQQNGTSYLPDPAGHLLVFVNGILQPPGASNAYTAFSDTIQFTEAPDLGASFTGFYVGKLRQLDDISFEFDSLRQSFNLKRNDVFYSLTLTEGVQSSTIRPENNILVSLNGVLQEPGIGFEIVGSRIIFSEIPRVGSTFVAFSYVGSEADVDAAEVVPPVEPGDFIDIQGETDSREVAVIESSNSLITFDYLGSVFGKDAQGSAAITQGFIDTVQVTAGGSGYTSRPTVRIDSISGFEGSIKALVGVGGVEISNPGSGYETPGIAVETSVPDDWTAPDLSAYGEEFVDPEIG